MLLTPAFVLHFLSVKNLFVLAQVPLGLRLVTIVGYVRDSYRVGASSERHLSHGRYSNEKSTRSYCS